ncbi:MAG: UDP-N-acetylmuramoyl-tripeptide--D-alanyl-D-alanine ligase, partial [Clostridiales bacterium]
DYIILVGQQRGEMMEEALIAKGYPPKCYYIAANLRDARIRLSQIVHKGDIVLYENDLPDLY